MQLDLDRTPTGQSMVHVDGCCELGFGPDGPHQVRVAGQLRVDNLEGRCVLRGELKATGTVACDRCLQEFVLDFSVPYEAVILRSADRQDDDSETPILYQRDGIVDLQGSVREAAVLAVPLSRLCRPDCRGICCGCGMDLNEGACNCEPDETDPRWDGLPG